MSDWQSHPSTRLDPQALGLPAKEHLELLGRLPASPRLAIVGSRRAHGRYLRVVEGLVGVAKAAGWTVVSGGALGIDAAVHKAALVHDCAQVAVLPCGRDRVYPPGHAKLFAEMLERGQGLLFSRPAGSVANRAIFASRNRIVVALASAVVVVEATLRSGSVGTGGLASRATRPLAALAGTSGCASLIGSGARALPDPDPDPARTLAAFEGWLGGRPSTPTSAWPPHLLWLREALRSGPASYERLATLGPAALALCEAEVMGLVAEASAGRWVALAE